jgi:hypothetical protein
MDTPKAEKLVLAEWAAKADIQRRATANIAVASGIGDCAFQTECTLPRRAQCFDLRRR